MSEMIIPLSVAFVVLTMVWSLWLVRRTSLRKIHASWLRLPTPTGRPQVACIALVVQDLCHDRFASTLHLRVRGQAWEMVLHCVDCGQDTVVSWNDITLRVEDQVDDALLPSGDLGCVVRILP